MSTITRQALRVYSALSVLGGSSGDVLDSLIPFFDPILAVLDNKYFDPRVFASGVRRLYGWRFTGDIASKFIPKFEQRGYLERISLSDRDVAWIVHYKPDAEIKDTGIDKVFEEIIDLFIKFPSRVSDLLYYSKTRDELKDALIRFLVSMDSQGQGAFSPELGKLEPSGEAQELLSTLEEGGRPLEPNDRYICARFVKFLMKNHAQYTEHLVRLSSIALLTEVVEDFLKPTSSGERSDLTIVIDAPLALDYLGCSGRAYKEDIVTIFDSLKSIGCKLVVLPITCDEMRHNLLSMLKNEPSERHGYTHNAIIKNEVTIGYVRAIANDPERALASVGITVRQINLDDNPAIEKYFTKDQYEDFLSTIHWVEQIRAREHDATCAALVMRLRGGYKSNDLFKSRYVLATRNSSFVKNTRKYCLQSKLLYETSESPVVHQRELAMAAWLRTGLGSGASIPRGHLVASCDRVLQLRPEVRRALANELSKVTATRLSEFNLLMQDSRSVQKLTDETFNDETVISAENAEKLLDAIRLATAEETRTQFEKELEDERAKSAADLAEIGSRLESTQAELERVAFEREQAHNRANKQILTIVKRINDRARILNSTIFLIMIALSGMAILQALTGLLGDYAFWPLLLMIAGGVSLYNLVCNVSGYDKISFRSLMHKYLSWELTKQMNDFNLHRDNSDFSFAKGLIVPPDDIEALDRSIALERKEPSF